MIDEDLEDGGEVRNSVPSEKFHIFLERILTSPEEDLYLKSIKIKPDEQRLLNPDVYYHKVYLWSSFIQSKCN